MKCTTTTTKSYITLQANDRLIKYGTGFFDKKNRNNSKNTAKRRKKIEKAFYKNQYRFD